MRLLVQRVKRASVDVADERVAQVGPGFLVLAGFGPDDGPGAPDAAWWRTMVEKLPKLRVFPDEAGKMNLSLADFGGEVLAVSQFTLYADCRKGLRPSFSRAAGPGVASALFDRLCDDLESLLPGRVRRGVFGADMAVELVNWGPVTIMLDSRDFS
ncbi:D-aminoacyl-tRNA deacylase [Fundidesulfovibrio terrae]|uniref:D-aminoacyl-tRNA deacylase n=1 Tax=Fundidesulfovibrio terrae TaxID=2922866 RepID=UPI001FAF4890